tara:strand:+ start:115 stop:309 length:195 start_codon:yes stop_codon:yes gene_type:complete
MITGTVKVWNQGSGWGFISGSDGEDYFLNVKNLRSGQSVRVGSNVKFDTEETDRGPQAVNVTLY